MPNTQLPSNLFESLKNLLLKKEKSLEKEQKVLSEEDPYRPDSDRTSGNSEVIDEALLEDARKLEIDSQKRSVSGMQQLVRKALALMKLGKYGVCEVCGDAIDPARLKAFPEASTCIRHSK